MMKRKITCSGVKGTQQHKYYFCLHNRPLKARRINDQLMLLDRAFLDPLAFPEQYGFRYEAALLKQSATNNPVPYE